MIQVSDILWKAWSVLWYKRRLGALGHRSWIRSPLFISTPKQVFIGDHCMIRDGARLEVVNRPSRPPGVLKLGNNVTIEQGAHIVATCEVILEDEVAIAPRVTIVDSTHPIGSPSGGNRARSLDHRPSYIHLKRRVFLGANVVVLPNVTIGENSVVGAGSVVTRDIPANCVAVGSPARVIKHL